MRCRGVAVAGHGGTRLVGEAFGDPDAPPVVLWHGTGQMRRVWEPMARRLAVQGWHAVTMDLRGHGDSGWSGDGLYDSDCFAGDTIATVRHLGGRAVLVGASLGGKAVLLASAEANPPIATRLVVVETAPRVEGGGASRIGEFLTAHLEGFATLEDVATAIARYRREDPRPAEPASLRQYVRQRGDGRWYWHWDPRVIWREGEMVRHRTEDDVQRAEDAARAIDVPTLIVRGERSDLVTEEAARHFLELVPHARLVVVPGVGHVAAGSDHEVFREAIETFLGSPVSAPP